MVHLLINFYEQFVIHEAEILVSTYYFRILQWSKYSRRLQSFVVVFCWLRTTNCIFWQIMIFNQKYLLQKIFTSLLKVHEDTVVNDFFRSFIAFQNFQNFWMRNFHRSILSLLMSTVPPDFCVAGLLWPIDYLEIELQG